MKVVSVCALPAASITWQPRPGAFAVSVVCKATFSIQPGECVLAAEQEPLQEAEIPWSEEPSRSPGIASDLAPLKPRAEVILVGRAFAPGGTRVRSLVARLVVGEIDKSIEIVGDRVVGQGGSLESAPFSEMPLVYERSAGGPETWNPVGVPPSAHDARGRPIFPNLLPPGGALLPAGFGPLAPDWPLRRAKLGRHSHHGLGRHFLNEPMPHDLDPAYFQAAPRDQQLAALRGDERMVLENLHAEIASLVTALPGVVPTAIVEIRGAAQPLSMRGDRLWIDTDRAVCTLTFRAELPVSRADEPGRIMIMLDSAGKGAPGSLGFTMPVQPGSRRAGEPALPFAPGPVEPPSRGADRSALGAPGLPFAVAPSQPAHLSWSPEVATPFYPSSLPMLPIIPVASPLPPAISPIASTPPRLSAAENIAAPPMKKLEVSPASGALGDHETLDLLWLDPAAAPRIRRIASFRAIVDELAEQAVDPELDDPETSRHAAEVENRRDLGEILRRGEPTRAEGMAEALRSGNRKGTFVPRLVLLEGQLQFPFDEIGLLRATVITVTPLIAGDESLGAAVAAANDFLRIPGLFSAPAVAEALTSRLRDVFRQGKRAVPPGYLEAQVDRAALEQRLYQRKTLFGAAHLRALLIGGAAPVPVYLIDSIAPGLPLFHQIRARLLGEVHPAVDQFETAPVAIRAVALGRIVALAK